MNKSRDKYDICVIGAGAAGLMSAIWLARTNPNRTVALLEGQSKLGAKILIAGGGRCNVTHYQVKPEDFCGSTKNSIKKVLNRFSVEKTTQFFEELGVTLKQEETGKLFPVSDSARTVLNALLNELDKLGVPILKNHRVEAVSKLESGFSISGEWGNLYVDKLVLATGGKSIPQTGSDGHGLQIAKQLGHTLTARLLPALVPLKLPANHPMKELSGITLETELQVRLSSGKRIASAQGNLLLTHQGISGPVVLDISRHYLDAAADSKDICLVANWLPDVSAQALEVQFTSFGKLNIRKHLKTMLPNRMADYLCETCQIATEDMFSELPKVKRKNLARSLTEMEIPISGSRGFQFAEVTAGGIPLSEIDLKTMQSRICPGLYLCGEICDVDGRIGGFNFQWAWASGYVLGASI